MTTLQKDIYKEEIIKLEEENAELRKDVLNSKEELITLMTNLSEDVDFTTVSETFDKVQKLNYIIKDAKNNIRNNIKWITRVKEMLNK